VPVTQIEKYPPSSPDIDRDLSPPGNSPSISTRFCQPPNELVAAFRAGSSVAFEQVQMLYSKRLYKQIVSITRSHEDAEDALQETFLRAFLARDSFEGRSHLCTWLTRIAINSALLVVRRRHANVWVSLTPPPESRADVYEFVIRDSAPSPEKVCDLKQRFNRVLNAIERLDFISRTVIEYRVTHEGSMKELANALNFSVGQVKTRLHRARKKLVKNVDHTRRTPVGPGLIAVRG
jgi:RNA polymerase sigma-70 factor, ECF subfamily